MFLIKKYCRILLISCIFLFLISTSVFAASPETIYFQRADDVIIKVDYTEAVRLYSEEDNIQLLEATQIGIIQGLIHYKGVWVQYEDESIYSYSDAVNDHQTYNEFYEDLDSYLVDPSEHPVALLLMYYDIEDDRIKYQSLRDFDQWINVVGVTYSALANRWVIDLEIIEGSLPDGYQLENIDAIIIQGKVAHALLDGEGNYTGLWRVILEASYGENNELINLSIDPWDVNIRFDDESLIPWHDFGIFHDDEDEDLWHDMVLDF